MLVPRRDPHRRRSAVPVRVLAAAAVAVLGVGCAAPTGGEAGKPAAQILTDAQAAADAADSVHISGTVAHPATAGAAPVTATLDLVLTSSGDGSEQISGAGQDIALVKVGSLLYVKGVGGLNNGAGYQQISVTDPRVAPLVAQLDKKTVFQQLIKSGTEKAATAAATVNGVAAVSITPGDGAGVLYVADDTAHPYPLKVETAPASASAGASASGPDGALTFTDWNAHTVIHPPS